MAVIVCGECGAEWPDGVALVAEHNELITGFLAAGYYTSPDWWVDDPDKVWCCPRCTHDF